jgi:hypothetical protein
MNLPPSTTTHLAQGVDLEVEYLGDHNPYWQSTSHLAKLFIIEL